jgi:hypothetical protein
LAIITIAAGLGSAVVEDDPGPDIDEPMELDNNNEDSP